MTNSVEQTSYGLEHYAPSYLVKLASMVQNGMDFHTLVSMSQEDLCQLYRAFCVLNGTPIEQAFGGEQ